jgi:hypothetical protein
VKFVSEGTSMIGRAELPDGVQLFCRSTTSVDPANIDDLNMTWVVIAYVRFPEDKLPLFPRLTGQTIDAAVIADASISVAERGVIKDSDFARMKHRFSAQTSAAAERCAAGVRAAHAIAIADGTTRPALR